MHPTLWQRILYGYYIDLRSALLLICLGLSFIFFLCSYQRDIAPFDTFVTKFLNHDLAKMTAPAKKLAVEPYVHGKVLIIDGNKKEVSPLQYRLPRSMKAHRPDELVTVIMLNYQTITVHYRLGHSGPVTPRRYKRRCIATFIDLDRRAMVGDKVIEGDPPPQVFSRGGEPFNAKLEFDLRDFVETLDQFPRRSLKRAAE